MSEPFDPIDHATRTLREPVATDPAAKHRLLEAVRRAPLPRRSLAQRAWQWIARPRPVMVSPLAGLTVAAAAALVIVLRPGADAAPGDRSGAEVSAGVAPRAPVALGAIPAALASTASPTTLAGPMPVQFVFLSPSASTVALVGDFNGWDPESTPLRAGPVPGVWVVEVPLSAGRHVYSFIVDGQQWHPDPFTPRAPESGADAPSSVVLVGGRSS